MQTNNPPSASSPRSRTANNGEIANSFSLVAVDKQEGWDALVDSHPLGNALQSYGWGLYKSRIGHNVRRLTVLDDKEKVVALALVATRHRMGFRVAHVSGGPLLFTTSPAVATKAITTLMEGLATGVRDIVVVEPELFSSRALLHGLLSAGLSPVMTARLYTITLDLSVSKDDLRGSFRRRFRRALRHAESNPELSASFVTSQEERGAALTRFAGFYADLAERKGFKPSFVPSAAHSIMRDDPRYRILEVREGGEPISIFISFRATTSITAFFAASSEQAGSNAANTLAYWAEIARAKDEGFSSFDCGGVNVFGDPGVYEFKTGMSDNLVQSGPIWVYARSWPIRALAALALVRWR